MLSVRESKQFDDLRGKADAAKDELTKQIDQYRKMPWSDREKSLMADFDRSSPVYQESLQKLENHMREGQYQEAVALWEKDLDRQKSHLEELVAKLAEDNRVQAEEGYQKALVDVAQGKTDLIGIGAGGLAVAGLLAYLIARALLQELGGEPEEAYSLAMVLANGRAGRNDKVFGSDISARVLAKAATAIYPNTRLDGVPESFLRAYFLRGTGKFADSVRVAPPIRQAVSFFQHNLMRDDASLGLFDVVFLRNALINFEPQKKQLILENVLTRLRPGGYLFIGLSESLSGHELPVKGAGRSIYRRL